MIKKITELMKPNLLGVISSSTTNQHLETLTGVGNGGGGDAGSLVGTSLTDTYYTKLWEWNWTDDNDLSTTSTIFVHGGSGQPRFSGYCVWDWGDTDGNATGDSCQLSFYSENPDRATTVWSHSTDGSSYTAFSTNEATTSMQTLRYELGQFRYIKFNITALPAVSTGFTAFKIAGVYRITE
jgi:hypothetical protein